MQGKRVLVGIISLGLVVVSASFAQDITEFQRQMMERMRKQMQSGQIQPPESTSTETVTQGKTIFNDPSLGTNGKSCGSCHQEGQKPLDGRQVNHHLVAYVQYCYEHALAGKKVIEKDKLDKIMSYFVSLKMAKTRSAPQIQVPQQEEESW